MLQQEKPEDFVIATGVTTTVRDFVRKAFNIVGIELEFEGENEYEIAKIKSCNNPSFQVTVGHVVVKVDPTYFRPTEVDLLIGDATKAHQKLGWKPKYDLDSLVEEMVLSDVELFKRN
jgi:GDPmannose 4,6-dehydratase